MSPDDETHREIQAAIDAFSDDCWRRLKAKFREVGALPYPEADDDQGRGSLKTVDDFLALVRAIPYRPPPPPREGDPERALLMIIRLQKPWYRRWYEDIFPPVPPPPKDPAERLARLQERVRNFEPDQRY